MQRLIPKANDLATYDQVPDGQRSPISYFVWMTCFSLTIFVGNTLGEWNLWCGEYRQSRPIYFTMAFDIWHPFLAGQAQFVNSHKVTESSNDGRYCEARIEMHVAFEDGKLSSLGFISSGEEGRDTGFVLHSLQNHRIQTGLVRFHFTDKNT